MGVADAIQALGIAGLVVAMVGVTRAVWPGTMNGRVVVIVAGAWTAILMGLAVQSGLINGTAFDFVAQWILQVASAIGLHSGSTTLAGRRNPSSTV